MSHKDIQDIVYEAMSSLAHSDLPYAAPELYELHIQNRTQQAASLIVERLETEEFTRALEEDFCV